MTKYEWSEPKSRKWVPVVRFIIAYVFFLIFSVGLTPEALFAMSLLATPEIDPDAISNDFEGMEPSFAFVTALLTIFFVSLVARLIAGWRRMLDPKRNLLIISTALIVFLVMFLPPDDWGSFRGGVWVPAPASKQTEYDIWTGLGAVIGFFLPLFIPAWDRQHGLTHITAILRRVAMIDGEITDAERQIMSGFCDEPFGMPDHVKERTMRDFNVGHQDTISVDKHLSAFKAKYGKNEDLKADFARMVWMMARSNGNPSHEREELARHVTQSLGVQGEEERSQSYQANQDQNRRDADILPPRAKNIVGLLAKMAKADGVIEKSEIQMISDFFEFGMGLPPDLKKAAISHFGTVKNDSHSFKHYADLCIRDVMQIPASEAEEAKHGIFGLLLELASADGEIHEREAEILEYVADKFGISDEFGGGQQRDTGAGNRSERTSSASGNKDEQHYAKILQISQNASKDEIKKAWREMIKSNHPDKVSHMSQAIQEFATEQTKLAQEAYEFFKQRGRA